jgi:uncharacterized SAM-binding protein YcdF (DUF218 family)
MRIEDLFDVEEKPEDQKPAVERPPYVEEKNPARTALSVILVLLFVLWSARSLILTGLGNWLVVSDNPGKADVIVVLSGDSSTRAPQGADLYRRGVSRRLLAIGCEVPSALQSLDVKLTAAQLTAMDLRRRGVSEDAIAVVTSTGTSTWEEAEYTRTYAKQHGLRSVVVVTSKFHTRRSKLTFERALRGTGVRVYAVPSRYDEMQVDEWWTREKELIAVNNEYLKLLLYGVKYLWR